MPNQRVGVSSPGFPRSTRQRLQPNQRQQGSKTSQRPRNQQWMSPRNRQLELRSSQCCYCPTYGQRWTCSSHSRQMSSQRENYRWCFVTTGRPTRHSNRTDLLLRQRLTPEYRSKVPGALGHSSKCAWWRCCRRQHNPELDKPMLSPEVKRRRECERRFHTDFLLSGYSNVRKAQ